MVIVKIGADTPQEREVEIVNEKGTWASGDYHIFAARFLTGSDATIPEPHDVNSAGFLGEMDIDKSENNWAYKGDKLSPAEQQEIARFILDYEAPDGVY